MVTDFVHDSCSPQAINIGTVGLGAGTFAVYGRKGDSITCFELDPKIKFIAEHFFTYLFRTKAKMAVYIGDGRKLLQELTPQNYDLLLIDAFNSDAIPCHLLTREAVQLYVSHLKPNGLLLFHTSNLFVDLGSLLGNLANNMHLSSLGIRYLNSISYVVICRDAQQIEKLKCFALKNTKKYPSLETYSLPSNPRLGIWTDDFSNLLSVLKLF
jgi:hypothetical protein